MASIYKHTYTAPDPATGERVTKHTKKWYVEYVDGSGRRRRVPGYTDRLATERLAADLETEAARVRAGILPANLNDVRRSLATHLEEYALNLSSKNDTAAHVLATRRRVEAVLTGCGFRTHADLDTGKVLAFLAKLRTEGYARKCRRQRQRHSLSTTNGYLRAVKGFSRWLSGKLGVRDPLAGLEGLNAEADLRRRRRSLAHQDFARLVETTAAGKRVSCRFTGRERAMLYLTAAYTGLRASELASLAPASFRFEAAPPTLTVLAGDSKHRREDTLPLAPELAVRLKAWLAGRPADQPLWPGTWAKYVQGTRMLKGDLKAAGVPYKDAQGRQFDFHALRGQYVTSLIRAGVPLARVQRLARHSTPGLTMSYTRLMVEDFSQDVSRLPELPRTGT